MPIKFQCSHCNSSIKAPETHAGKNLPCPKCGQTLSVPMAKPAPASVATEQTGPAAEPDLPQVSAPEPEADAIPEIIVRQPGQAKTPPPVSKGEVPTAPNAFAPPQTRSTPAANVDRSNVRIVDLRLPFSSVFRFAVQFFLCNLLLSLILGLVFFIISLLLAAIGMQFTAAAATSIDYVVAPAAMIDFIIGSV